MSDNITSLSQDVKKLAVKDSKQVNILLLGETGVGKSTFINAIANYLHFEKFKRAEKEPLRVLIPATITITDDNFQQKKISVGKSDKNEFLAVGAAATQGVKSYVFQIGDGKVNLRLIDTPGMGDPKGVEQDNKNCENILAYLSQLQDLHAICFLMKPTNPRITVMFEYCFKQILSRLDASASKNIVFIFTHTRSEHYRGGETFPCLEKVVKEIMDKQPKVKIAMDKNVFYVDNEAFRILAAMSNGVTFGEQTRPLAVESWKTSSKECWRLINYILGDPSNDPLPPHQLRNSTSINEARRLITHLSQPLVEITQLISDNIRILDRHRHDLNVQSESLDEMKKKMYIPVVNLKVTSLPEPATVCTSSKCVDFVKIGNETLKHYKRRCHERCYLPSITQEMIGEPGLVYCEAMENKMCKKCTCDFSVHMHVYYLTTPFDDKIEDINVVQNIATEERALEETLKLLEKIDDRKKDLEKERDAIVNATAKFASFLQNNAITPFNDSYKAYIEYMITREKGFGLNADPRVIKNLENLMSSHEELKKVFDEQTIDKGDDDVATNHTVARTVMDTVFNLYKLPLYGKQIRKLMQNQVGSRKYEYNQNCEYVHPEYVKSVSVDKKKDQSDAESKKKNKEAKDKKKEKSEGDSKKGKKDEKEGKPDSKKGKKDEKEDKPESKKGKKDEKESKSDGGTKKKEQFKPKPQQQQQRREPPPPYAEQQNVQKSNDNDSTIKVNIQLTQPKTKEQFPPPPQHYPPPAYGQPPYAYGAPGGNYYGPPGPQGYGPPPPPPGPHGYGPPPTPPGPHGYGPQPPAHQGGLPSYPPQWYQPQPPPAAASYWPPPYDSSSSYPQPPSGGQKSNSNRKQGGKPVEKQQNKPKKDNTKKKTKKSSDSSE